MKKITIHHFMLKTWFWSNCAKLSLFMQRQLDVSHFPWIYGNHQLYNADLYEPGALHDILHLNDVLARVALAKLCHSLSRARALDGKWIEMIFHIWLEGIIKCPRISYIGHFVTNAVYAERPDIKSQFNSLLYQLLVDPSERVCFQAIQCVLGKFDNSEGYISSATSLHLFLFIICWCPPTPQKKKSP